MRNQLSFVCLALSAGLLLSGPAAAAPGPGLVPAQIQSLKSLKTSVVVPYYLPAGCKPESLRVQAKEDADNAAGYTLRYACGQGSRKSMFQLEGTSGGIGDAEGDSNFKLASRNFGQIQVEYYKLGGTLPGLKQPMYTTQWFGKGPLFFSFTTGNGRIDSPYPTLPKAEVLKIIQALGYLK
ncbi:MAG TPA: hypothetical protein V6D23_03525 [Candidatus Obscuribacterales bacterium]